MAREDREERDEAERHCAARRARRLLRKRHLSKQERCELAEITARELPPGPETAVGNDQ